MGKPGANSRRNFGYSKIGFTLIELVVVVVLLVVVLPSFLLVNPAPHLRLSQLSDAATLSFSMMYYASDHGGQYPDGASSTEVFQKLMDEGYLSVEDATDHLYMVGMPGKTPYPGSGPLQPENVCWDVIAPLDANEDVNMPVVISTGWKIPEYRVGKQPEILNRGEATTMQIWGDGMFASTPPRLVIGRKRGDVEFLEPNSAPAERPMQREHLFPEGLQFQPGKEYRQLRP